MDGIEGIRSVQGSVWIGMDIHKKNSVVTAFNGAGDELGQWQFRTTSKEIGNFTKNLPKDTKIALEASTTGKAVFHRLRNAGLDVHMASPRELKAITSSDVKTDKRDSYHLGNLLRNNYFPECYVPPMEIERVRDLVRFRMGLGQQVTVIKNQIHALVSKNLLDSEMDEYSDWFGKAGLVRLAGLPISDDDRVILQSYLEQLALLISQEENASCELAGIGNDNTDVKLLMTIPGIDFYGALGILGEVGDIHRFDDKKKLYSYAGLVPKADNSGEMQSKHRRVKRGNRVLKYFLCCAVYGALRAKKPNAVASFYRKKSKQIGSGKAQVAAARKLSGIVWKILITGEPYSEEDPALSGRKIAKMGVKAKISRVIPTDQGLIELAEAIGSKEDVLNRMLPMDFSFDRTPSPEGVAPLTPSGSGRKNNRRIRDKI